MVVNKYISSFIFLLSFVLNACGQDYNDRTVLGEEFAKDELKKSLIDTVQYQYKSTVSQPLIITDKKSAIAVAEPILFKTYGKKNIMSERPYEIYHIDNFWVMLGTIPKNSLGEGFLIILDERNGKTVRLTHWQ